MSIMNVSAASSHRRQRRVGVAASLKHLAGERWQRLRSRYELQSLGEEGLRDIGLTSSEALFESSKPFWQR
jgi:uncharacterized protein YjiS (DUF1127 family)